MPHEKWMHGNTTRNQGPPCRPSRPRVEISGGHDHEEQVDGRDDEAEQQPRRCPDDRLDDADDSEEQAERDADAP